MTPLAPPPPGLLAVALLFWGYTVGPVALVIAAGVGLAVELPRFLVGRVSVATAVLARVFDAGLMLSFIATAVIAVDSPVATAVKVVLHWLPLMLAPFVVLQSWNTPTGIDLKALWWQSQRRTPAPMAPFPVDFRWLYAPVVLIAAGAASEPGPLYYAVVCALAGWALLVARSRRSSVVAFGLAFAAAVVLGHVAHQGLSAGQGALARMAVDVLSAGDDTDPYNRRTAIGEMGEIKLSDAIVLRVTGDRAAYLHRATYDVYTAGSWSASARLAPVSPAGAGRWSTARVSTAFADRVRELAVSARHGGGRAVLAAPFGTVEVASSDLSSVRRSALGVLEQSARDSGAIDYAVRYDPAVRVASMPGDRDLRIGTAEAGVLSDIARSLPLPANASAAARVDAVERWFGEGFRYALYQPDAAPDGNALTRFLTEHRYGHCEYYASATVLLLRELGVPARYVTGFSVQEWSELEQAWVVRRRHAHAWVRAWVDGRWIDVDTTPSTWFEVEQGQASSLQPLLDAFDYALHRFRTWRNDPERAETLPWFAAAGALVLVILAVRLVRRVRLAQPERKAGDPAANAPDDPDNAAWRRFEAALAELGWPRGPAELPSRWVERLADSAGFGALGDELRALVRHHYRLRFSGDEGDSHAFSQAVDECIAALRNRSASRGG